MKITRSKLKELIKQNIGEASPGAEKAKKVANTTLNRFRKTLGYNI